MAIAVRASSIVAINTNSYAYPFPTGSAAGDSCVISVGHGWAVNVPAGWTQLHKLDGSNTNGATFWKLLTAADITAGSVTITFAGSYNGVIAGITFIGGLYIRTSTAYRNGAGATSRTLTTDTTPAIDDYAIYFGFGRFNGTVTVDSGTALQTVSAANGSGVLTGALLTVAGAEGAVFTYSAAPAGDYGSIVVVDDFPPGLTSSKMEAGLWSEQTTGLDVTKGEAGLWADPTSGLDVTKIEVGLWADPIPPGLGRRMSLM